MLTEKTRFRWLGCLSTLKGLRYRLGCRVLRRNVKVGGNFKLVGGLKVAGTGRVRVGAGCSLRGRNKVRVLSGAVLTIGERVQGDSLRVICHDSIQIGDNCLFGCDCIIRDGDGHSTNPYRRGDSREEKRSPVRIEDDCWIGDRTIILKGVTIGHGSTIGAGSVVSKSIPPFSLAAGNPARVIQTLGPGGEAPATAAGAAGAHPP